MRNRNIVEIGGGGCINERTESAIDGSKRDAGGSTEIFEMNA